MSVGVSRFAIGLISFQMLNRPLNWLSGVFIRRNNRVSICVQGLFERALHVRKQALHRHQSSRISPNLRTNRIHFPNMSRRPQRKASHTSHMLPIQVPHVEVFSCLMRAQQRNPQRVTPVVSLKLLWLVMC